MDLKPRRVSTWARRSRRAGGESMKAGKAMAQGTDNRPEFPNPDRPLYTPDESAQQQVVARIAQARKGKKTRKRKEPEGADAHRVVATFTITQRRGLRMGEHPHVGRNVLAEEWGMGHTKADELAKHPEDMDRWQVRQLCDLCGVTLEWLRGWEDENAYGRYETAETIAAMYGHLSNEDRRLVTDLLTRLLGADAAQAIKHEQWERDNREWPDRNPERVQEVIDAVRNLMQAANSSTRDAARVVATAQEAILAAVEPVQDIAQTYADRTTADESLAHARDDSMEG